MKRHWRHQWSKWKDDEYGPWIQWKHCTVCGKSKVRCPS